MKAELPFFSLIVPTYERPAQLAACLGALARLDYPPERFEIIVVDDGSTVAPSGVVERFRESLEVKLYSQKNALRSPNDPDSRGPPRTPRVPNGPDTPLPRPAGLRYLAA